MTICRRLSGPAHCASLLIPGLLLFVSSALAIGPTFPFEGRIPAGSSAPGQHYVDMTFTLYPSQAGGSPVWTEIHLGIPVKDNRFKVMLGKNNPLEKLEGDKDYYLAVQMGLKMDAPEIAPRQLIFKSEAPKAAAPVQQAVKPVPAASSVTTPAAPSVATAAVSLPSVQVSANGASSRELASIKKTLDRHIKNANAHHGQGQGSKLDADLLDGKDSSFFVNKEELEAHAQNKKNPHGVTALQIDSYTRAEVAGLIGGLQQKIAALEAKLKYVSVSGTEMHISGANLHIENGSGATDGKLNGLGNVIIGYNDPADDKSQRTGSHNLIIGDKNHYTSYGGLVAGYNNTVSAPYCSVSGGQGNTTSGKFSAITGGRNNTTKGENSVVSGGIKNITIGEDDWAAGGLFQTQ